MKKFLSIALALCMIFALCAVSASADGVVECEPMEWKYACYVW